MCRCDPRVRTPFCGKLNCTWPKAPSSDTDELDKQIIKIIVEEPDDTIVQELRKLIATKEQEAYKKGYIDSGINEILRHDQAKAAITKELKGGI